MRAISSARTRSEEPRRSRAISISMGVGAAWGLFLVVELEEACSYALKKLLMSGRVEHFFGSSFMLCSTGFLG